MCINIHNAYTQKQLYIFMCIHTHAIQYLSPSEKLVRFDV